MPVASAIRNILSQPDYDDGSIGPVLVRLSWHSSGTFDSRALNGGSDGGRMRFAPELIDPANTGLQNAMRFLETIKKEFSWISYGDLYTLAGATAIEAMGGPQIPWRAEKMQQKKK